MKVRFTAPAEADLEEIGDWIAREDPERAASFIRELRGAAAGLGRDPRRCPAVPGFNGQIRKKSYRQYLILYRVRGSEVQILRFVQGSRDWMNILDGA